MAINGCLGKNRIAFMAGMTHRLSQCSSQQSDNTTNTALWWWLLTSGEELDHCVKYQKTFLHTNVHLESLFIFKVYYLGDFFCNFVSNKIWSL